MFGIEQHTEALIPLLVYTAAVLGLIGLMLGLSYVLGESHKEKATDDPYESGVKITGSARLRFSSHFYLVAMFFVIFDLEAAFIIAWAIAFGNVGLYGYIGAAIFIGILLIVLLYEWSIGALDFGPNRKAIFKAYRQKVKAEKAETN